MAARWAGGSGGGAPRPRAAPAAARWAGGSKGGAASPRQSQCTHTGYAGPRALVIIGKARILPRMRRKALDAYRRIGVNSKPRLWRAACLPQPAGRGISASSAVAREAAEIQRGTETHHPSPGNAHRLVRPRIPRHARLAGARVEHPEAPEHYPVAARQGGNDGFEPRVHRVLRGGRVQFRRLHRPGDEVHLHHAGRILCDMQPAVRSVPRGTE